MMPFYKYRHKWTGLIVEAARSVRIEEYEGVNGRCKYIYEGFIVTPPTYWDYENSMFWGERKGTDACQYSNLLISEDEFFKDFEIIGFFKIESAPKKKLIILKYNDEQRIGFRMGNYFHLVDEDIANILRMDELSGWAFIPKIREVDYEINEI